MGKTVTMALCVALVAVAGCGETEPIGPDPDTRGAVRSVRVRVCGRAAVDRGARDNGRNQPRAANTYN